MFNYKVGQVYRTEEPFTSTGKDSKSRYFIYLGRGSIFDSPIYLFSCTTTTRLERYKEQQDVCIHFEYTKELFTQPCLICLDDVFDSMTVEEFESYKPTFAGNIEKEKIIEIKQKLNNADISKKVKKDILDSFKRDGI